MVRQVVETIESCDRPGRYFAELPFGENYPQRMQRAHKGITYSGHWYGVRSIRPMLPWIRYHPEFTNDELRRAAKVDPCSRKAISNRVLRSATKYVQRN